LDYGVWIVDYKMNKRAQQSLTKTGILFTIAVFYIFIIAMIGYAGSFFSPNEINYGTDTTITNDYSKCNCGALTCYQYWGFYGESAVQEICRSQGVEYQIKSVTEKPTNVFGITTITYGLSSLPTIVNGLLFTPLLFIIAWILASSLPTFNGGG
jgi:hypothetical protein